MEDFLAACEKLRPEDLYGHHIVPAAWDAPGNHIPFPFPKTYTWESLEVLCTVNVIQKTIICATPFFWQLEPLVYKVAHTRGAPVAVVSPKNLALIRPYAEQAGVDMILAAPDTVEDIIAILSQTNSSPKILLVIHHEAKTLPRKISAPPGPYVILHELHLFPGLPLFLSISNTNARTGEKLLFTRNASCTWSTSSSTFTLPNTCGTWPPIHIPMQATPSTHGYSLYE